ncbi:SDR family NAD(P)-dependent oxidoreductase [Streptomyces eurythermus]|uniref:SDR family NAD(P)-dependent oxidoreductase n=1 Tax=Streptomyces eurythermus TaxID=42237 RepID=UPI0033C4E640
MCGNSARVEDEVVCPVAGQNDTRRSPGVAVITGAGRGIGRATAQELARRGYRLLLCDVNGAAVRATASALPGDCVAVTEDVCVPDTADALAGQALAAFGRLDVWVNNAGVIPDGTFGAEPVPLTGLTVQTNLMGVLAGCRAAWPVMREQRKGHIVNVASACGIKPLAGLATYSATKAAVMALSDALRREGRQVGIRVSAVAPYMVRTPAASGLRHRVLRPLRPEDVARAIAGTLQRPGSRLVVPRRLGAALTLEALLPRWARDLLDDLLGMDTLALCAAPRQRAAYRAELARYGSALPPGARPGTRLVPAPTAPEAPDGLPHAPASHTTGVPAGPLPGLPDPEAFAPHLARHIDELYPLRPDSGTVGRLTAADTGELGTAAALRVQQRLHTAMVEPVRYLLDGGGRRWRPGLMSAVMEALGADSRRYGRLMAASELMHTGSLIVDDIEDGAPTRRGRPSTHLRYGTACAVNAGTAAYFAMDAAIRATLPGDPHLRGRLYEVYLAALRAAHAGQALDLQGHHTETDTALATGDHRTLLEILTLTHRLKSGAPVGALFRTAALLADATPAQQTALARLGEAVGIAYQITDDIADLEGVRNNGTQTKQPLEDLRNGKVTFPLAWALALLPPPEAIALWHSVRTGAGEADLHRAAARITDSGAVERCRNEADGLLHTVWQETEHLLPDTPATARLREMCGATVRRGRVA